MSDLRQPTRVGHAPGGCTRPPRLPAGTFAGLYVPIGATNLIFGGVDTATGKPVTIVGRAKTESPVRRSVIGVGMSPESVRVVARPRPGPGSVGGDAAG